MLHFRLVAISCLLGPWAVIAQADWIVVGAAYQCNKNDKTFSLHGTIDTSSPEDPGTIRTKPGFTELNEPTNTIKCSIGKTEIVATVRIVSPQAQGMCMGIGFVDLQLLKINDRKVFEYPETFNSGCFFEPVLFSIDVDATHTPPKVKLCRGKWDWGVGYADAKCEEKVFR